MTKSTSSIIIDESYVQLARCYGFCIHYDESLNSMYFITINELETNEENDPVESKAELKLLFGFFEDVYKVYFLLPNRDVKNTYKAHYCCSCNVKKIMKKEFPSTLGNTIIKRQSLDFSNEKYGDLFFNYERNFDGEPLRILSDSIYRKWHNEIDNIVDFMNQEKINLPSEDKDYGVVLYCEEVTNPNYAIIFLSIESNIVKIDKSTFNSFVPKEGQIYKLTKKVEYNIAKSSVVIKKSNVLFLHEMVSECDNMNLLFTKYEQCYRYASMDVNRIDLNSIEHEGYFLINYTGTEVKLKNNKVTKHLRYDFILEYESNYKNVGKMYVGKSLVCIKKKRKEFEFVELRSFGRLIEMDVYNKDGNKKSDKYAEENNLSNAKKEEDFWNNHFHDEYDDEIFEAELYIDSEAVFGHETKTDYSSELEDYFDEEDGHENDHFDGNGIKDHLDLRVHYNARNSEFEMCQSIFSDFEDYDSIEEQEREFEKEFSEWVKKKFGVSIYEGVDVSEDRFYLNFKKRKYAYETLCPKDRMFLATLYDRELMGKINKDIDNDTPILLTPERKSRNYTEGK